MNAQADILGSVVPQEQTGEFTIVAFYVKVIEPAGRSTPDRITVKVAAQQWRYLGQIRDSQATTKGVAYLVWLPHLVVQIPVFVQYDGQVFYGRNWEQRYEVLPADLCLVDWEHNDGRVERFLDDHPTVQEA